VLPKEAKEIKPHPYGVELGRLITMLGTEKGTTVTSFLTNSFSCVTPAVARKVCEVANISTRSTALKVGQTEAERLYKALQETKIRPPSTDCIAPIGSELLYKGLKAIVPGEFHDAITRPPSVQRGSPFQIEVALAYGGNVAAQKITRDELVDLIGQSDAKTLRKFLIDTFQLELLDPGKRLRVRKPLMMNRIEVLERVQSLATHPAIDSLGVRQVKDRIPTGPALNPLIHTGQKTTSPKTLARIGRFATRKQDDIPWQILVLGTQPVGRPSPQRRVPQTRLPGMNKQLRRRVIELVGLHRTDNRYIIGMLGQPRQELGHPLPALPMLGKGEHRSEHLGNPFDERKPLAFEVLFGTFFAIEFLQRWLVVKELQLRRGARKMDVDHSACTGLLRWGLRGQRTRIASHRRRLCTLPCEHG
jgi:hypothetical protein